MTDEELGRAIVDTWRTTSSGYAVVGARARALLSPPVATREAVRKWMCTTESIRLLDERNLDGILAALSHFAPPASNVPILRMSEAEIGIAMRAEVDDDPRNWSIGDCARVAHRLAQPVPVVDPDAAAKDLAKSQGIDWSTTSGDVRDACRHLALVAGLPNTAKEKSNAKP